MIELSNINMIDVCVVSPFRTKSTFLEKHHNRMFHLQTNESRRMNPNEISRFRQHSSFVCISSRGTPLIKHGYNSLFKVPIIKNFLLKNAQFNFSSRFPRDVIDNALMNSSNSIEPSYGSIVKK